MRVIAGQARRIQLNTVAGDATRPTTDRIKETLFNMLQNNISQHSFLDLFAGSGAIGIEALSRGAAEAVFVENNKAAVACIKDNLKRTRLEENALVQYSDVLSEIRKQSGRRKFDYVFMDPPYQGCFEEPVLRALLDCNLLHEDSVVIVEALLDTSFDFAESIGYTIVKEKKYKTNKHVFLRTDREKTDDHSNLSGQL